MSSGYKGTFKPVPQLLGPKHYVRLDFIRDTNNAEMVGFINQLDRRQTPSVTTIRRRNPERISVMIL